MAFHFSGRWGCLYVSERCGPPSLRRTYQAAGGLGCRLPGAPSPPDQDLQGWTRQLRVQWAPEVTPGVNSPARSPDLEPASVGCLTSRMLLGHPRVLGFWSERQIRHTYRFRSPNVEQVFRAQRAVAFTGSGKQFGEGRWDLGHGVGCRPLGWGTSLLLGSCLAGVDRGLLQEWGPLGVGQRLRFGDEPTGNGVLLPLPEGAGSRGTQKGDPACGGPACFSAPAPLP